jgi:hypothetical protein
MQYDNSKRREPLNQIRHIPHLNLRINNVFVHFTVFVLVHHYKNKETNNMFISLSTLVFFTKNSAFNVTPEQTGLWYSWALDKESVRGRKSPSGLRPTANE